MLLSRRVLIPLASFGGVVPPVLGWWYSISKIPTKLELLTHLVVLPVCLVICLYLAQQVVCWLQKRPWAKSAAQNERHSSPQNSIDAMAHDSVPVFLLDSVLVAGKSQNADALMKEIEKSEPPNLSSDLLDPEGFPVFISPISSDLGNNEETNFLGVEHTEASKRELEIVSYLVVKLVAKLLLYQRALDTPVRIVWILSHKQTGVPQQLWVQWLENRLEAAGLYSKVMIQVDAMSQELDGKAIFRREFDKLSMAQECAQCWLVTASSYIDQEVVDQLASQGKLFTHRHLNGLIPGEAGVALLLANQPSVNLLDFSPAVRLHSPLDTENIVTNLGDKSPVLLHTLIDNALERAGIPPSDIATVVADTDHQAANIRKFHSAVGCVFSDDVEIVKALLGKSIGFVGQVCELVVAALVREYVLASDRAVIAILHMKEGEEWGYVASVNERIDTVSSTTLN